MLQLSRLTSFPAQKNEVQQFVRHSIKSRLKGPDARLPSVLFISELVSRGIAVHHAGMLPLLKETVEMLFQRGLIRLLFATETFAMGVNMPARCVLFSTLEKFDGRGRRPLNPGEYTQMAGRAGRRGLDASGTVIIIAEGIGASVASAKTGIPTQETLTRMILGTPSPLSSQFKITYSMILHLHRSNWLSPQDIMRRSFMEANSLRRETDRRLCLASLRACLSRTTTPVPSAGATVANSSLASTSKSAPLASVSSIPVGEPMLQVNCPFGLTDCVEPMTSYYQACSKFRQLRSSLTSALARQPLHELQRVFCPGRLVFIQTSNSANDKPPYPHSVDNLAWLVPAVLVDVSKACVHGVTEIQWSLITWEVPDKPSAYSATETAATVSFDVEAEEAVLRDGEDSQLSATPVPPQLMPLFIPESFDDALSRLTLLSEQDPRTLVRVCDRVVDFKCHSTSSKSTSNPALAELLARAICRHRQEIAASEAGFRLVVGTTTSLCNSELPQLVLLTNEALLALVEPFGTGEHADDATRSSRPVLFGLPVKYPAPLHVGRALRTKSNSDDVSALLDEWALLGEQLTTPLHDPEVTDPMLSLRDCPDVVSHLAMVHRTCRRRWAVKRLEQNLSQDKLQLNNEYTGRLRVLEELGFIDSATERGCLSLKGLVACELQQMEVLLTQLLLDGSFTQLPPADIAALLSCFVFEIRSQDATRDDSNFTRPVSNREQVSHLLVLDSSSLQSATTTTTNEADDHVATKVTTELSAQQLASVPHHLHASVCKMFDFAKKLEQLQLKYNLNDPTSDTRLNCSLVRATYAWATGHPFATLVQLTSMPEGQLVRGLLRLDELVRHICSACHRLGDQALGIRMNEARQSIHRDLVCAPSLYVSDEFVSSLSLEPENDA